jgi:hypothetical protein
MLLNSSKLEEMKHQNNLNTTSKIKSLPDIDKSFLNSYQTSTNKNTHKLNSFIIK